MDEAAFLVDTDILIDELRTGRSVSSGHDLQLAYSIITRAELFAGVRDDPSRLRQLLASMVEFEVDQAIAEHAGSIRGHTGLKLPDALIAATAVRHEIPLVTRNVRDFDRVPGLQLSDFPS